MPMKMILQSIKSLPVSAHVFLATCCVMGAVVGCSTFGRNPSPPTKLETSLFQVTTNYVPVVIPAYTTNNIQVTQTLTNYQGITLTNYATNTVLTVIPATTNLQAQYNYGPGGTLSGAQGIVSTIPIYGTLASTALGVLGSVWGWLRSTKNRQTAANTMQVVATMRQFIQALPNGGIYDTALTHWMRAHQADSGVLNEVLTLLGSEVSNPDAQFAANSVIATINGLGATPLIQPPPAPKA
jgi:hypothetical protein